MKKIIVTLLAALFIFGSVAQAQVIKEGDIGENSLSWNLTWTKSQFNADSELIGSKGISFGFMGYHSKTYYSPAKVGEFNKFWNWGTGLFILPYIGIGMEYYFNTQFSLDFTANLATIIPAPIMTARIHF